MQLSVSSTWLVAILMLSARLAPIIAFASPFAMMNMAKPLRVAVVLALAAALSPLTSVSPELIRWDTYALLFGVAGELVVGAAIAFALQSAFGVFLSLGEYLIPRPGTPWQ